MFWFTHHWTLNPPFIEHPISSPFFYQIEQFLQPWKQALGEGLQTNALKSPRWRAPNALKSPRWKATNALLASEAKDNVWGFDLCELLKCSFTGQSTLVEWEEVGFFLSRIICPCLLDFNLYNKWKEGSAK